MNKFLVTTALEESWPENEQVLFLGEWCRQYSRRERWLAMEADILPYHWDNIPQYDIDVQYLDDLYERVLAILANELNKQHNVDHGLRYWRILLGTWLTRFVPTIFDRWTSIQLALENSDISNSIVLNGKVPIANNVEEFSKLVDEDLWNHYVYAYILKNYTDVDCIERINENTISSVEKEPINIKWKINLKNKLLEVYSKISNYFIKDSDVFMINTYLPVFEEMKLHWSFGQIPMLWRSIDPVRVSADLQQRRCLFNGQDNTKFEKCLLELISQHIPVVYLEGYNQLVEQINNLPWPKQPKLIFSSNVLWNDSVSIAYIAEKVEQGTPLVYGQHGGVYGISKYTWFEKHEIAVSDRYLSWGWDDISQPKIKPLGMLTKLDASIRENQTTNIRKRLLFVAINSFRYANRIGRDQLMYYKNYFDNSFKLYEYLRTSIQNEFLVRVTAVERGWYQPLRWKDRFPEIAIDTCTFKMKDLLKETRIAIYSYNSTGYLEAFSLDIPAIIFWRQDESPLREVAAPYFEELKRVGIFHETPESAAKHINKVWDDVDAWWQSNEVCEVLDEFKVRYCRRSDRMLEQISDSLNEVIATS